MKKAMTIVYTVGEGLYLNLTNRCPCACTFCIRNGAEGAYGSDPLWLDHEPDFGEVCAALDGFDIAAYREAVFCGFGEPTERLDLLLETAEELRRRGAKHIRLNTNGLADLIHGRPTAALLKGHIDTVSVSLNAGTPEAYTAVTRPKWGAAAFPAMLDYTRRCRQYVEQVQFTVVDVLPPAEMAAAKALAQKIGIPLRIRQLEDESTRR